MDGADTLLLNRQARLPASLMFASLRALGFHDVERGLFAFALVAWGSMMALLKVVSLKGDQTKTMEDYMKAGRDVAH